MNNPPKVRVEVVSELPGNGVAIVPLLADETLLVVSPGTPTHALNWALARIDNVVTRQRAAQALLTRGFAVALD